jgi:hypothetical protein
MSPLTTRPLLNTVTKMTFKTLTLMILCISSSPAFGEIDPQTNRFYFRDNNPFPDDTLGRIALYLIQQEKLEGNAYVSNPVGEGIVEYQIRFFDNGNKGLVDEEDIVSVRRYTIPPPRPEPAADAPLPPPPVEAPPEGEEATPPPPPPPQVLETRYIEYVDHGLNGLDELDYYFLNGRRFDLAGRSKKSILEFRSQVATAINIFIEKIDYDAIVQGLGSSGQTGIRKGGAYDDGSLPSLMVLGLDMPYVFKPIVQQNSQLDEEAMMQEIRQRIGFVYSATVGYTDLSGYRFRDIADQTSLLQRHYDDSEYSLLELIIDALFDVDGDGLISQENISNGYTRFRELHQQISDNARGQSRRVVLPNEKLARIRQEYESVHQKTYTR